MITLEHVTRRFGRVTAIDDLSLSVNKGEIFGIVGPDGAGKTTLLRMIIGVLEPTAGKITLLGSDRAEEVKERIGYVPQRFSLYGDLTVMENIAVMGALYGANKEQVAERGRSLLAFTNLLPFADRLADNLSGGMKQKLSLAAGLMHQPEVFFLDEPTTGVDPVSRREFWQTLYRLNKDGMTVVVSTPYMDEAELCNTVACLDEGRLVACGSPAALKAAYPYHVLELTTDAKALKNLLAPCPIIDINPFGDVYHIVAADAAETSSAIRSRLAAAGITGYELRNIAPQLEDVFVQLAKGGDSA